VSYNPNRVNFLVKLRDAAQMIADAINEELDSLNPATKTEFNPEKIPWVKTEGQSGPYERYPAFQQKADEMNVDYQALLTALRRHNDKLSHAGLFYWLFSDDKTIGRKPAKKSKT